MAKNAYQLATDVKAIAIVTPTLSGSSARMVSQFRPEQTVIAVTPNKQVQRQLLLNWEVHPILTEFAEDSKQMIQNAIKKGLDAEIIHLNDRIVALAGIPLNNPVKANTIKVILVGNVITSGTASYNSAAKVSGRVVKVTEPEDALPYIKNANGGIILVCPRLTENFLPLLRLVNGVVCETGSDIPKNYLSAVNHDFVWILNAANAMRIEQNLTVTLDGERGLVYEGLC